MKVARLSSREGMYTLMGSLRVSQSSLMVAPLFFVCNCNILLSITNLQDMLSLDLDVFYKFLFFRKEEQ